MPILKITSKNAKVVNSKMVGVQFPVELHSYFSLFALAKGVTKSSIVKELMNDWYNTCMEESDLTPKKLMADLLYKIRIEWKKYKVEKPFITLVEFKKTIKNELKHRGIDTKIINVILKQL
jgi:hypothetical protein